MITKTITFLVEPEMNRKLRVKAAEKDMNKSEAIREAIQLWLSSDPIMSQCCGSATVAKDGVRYCAACGDAVMPVSPDDAPF